MDAREYLSQISSIDRRIIRLKHRLADIEAMKVSIKSPANMHAEPGGGSDREERILTLMEKSDAYIRQILAEIDRLLDRKEQISKEIDSLPDKRHSDVLYYRYVLCMKWEDVAQAMNYNERWVKQLEVEAVESFAATHFSTKQHGTSC